MLITQVLSFLPVPHLAHPLPTSLQRGAIFKSCIRDEETDFGKAELTKTRIGETGLMFDSVCDELGFSLDGQLGNTRPSSPSSLHSRGEAEEWTQGSGMKSVGWVVVPLSLSFLA